MYLVSSNLNEGKFISLPRQFSQKSLCLFPKFTRGISGDNIKYLCHSSASKRHFGSIFGQAKVLGLKPDISPCFYCAPSFLISVIWVSTTFTTTAFLKVLDFGVVFQAGLWKEMISTSDETAISRECLGAW